MVLVTAEPQGPWPRPQSHRMSRDGLLDPSPCSSHSDRDAQVHGHIQGGWPGRQLPPQSLYSEPSRVNRDSPASVRWVNTRA